MMHTIDYWLGDTMVIVLVAVAAMGISTAIAFLKGIKKQTTEALIYFTLSAFLWTLHMIWIFYAPPESILFHHVPDFWQWLVFMFSPALIIVFLIHAAYWYAKSGGWPALIRTFCAVTLAGLLFMFGQDWSISLKGALTMIWVVFLWRVEFPRKHKRPAFIFVTRRLL
jgi:hypothetical protein